MARLAAALLLAAFVVPSQAEPPDLAAIDDEVRLALKNWQVPGVAVVIVRPDRVVLLKGYGVRELGRDSAVTAETLFPIASCTKSFTSTALAILVDQGRVNWEDPVRKYLPPFHLSEPHADALVTVRDLMSHRTGVGGHDLLWYRTPGIRMR